MIGRGWFGALYAVLFILWGLSRIIEEPHGFNLILGVLVLVVGLASGLMWLRHWEKARKTR
jgi:hypothetical protein